jgi:hypothetical protein
VIDEEGRQEEAVDGVEKVVEVQNPGSFPWCQTILTYKNMDLREGTDPRELQKLVQKKQVLLWEPKQVIPLCELALQEKERREEQETREVQKIREDSQWGEIWSGAFSFLWPCTRQLLSLIYLAVGAWG